MRRFVLMSAMVAVLMIGVASGAASAGSQHGARSNIILCPQPATITVPTCCGPPLAAIDPSCCPGVEPAQPCGTGVSITASPNPATAGQKVVVSGRLTPGTAGTKLALWQRLPGHSSFSQVASTTSGALGDYSFTQAAGSVMTNREWYVTAGTAQSVTLDEQVQDRITISVAPRHPRRGARVTFSGVTRPGATGETIMLEQLTGATWTTIATCRVGTTSRFRLRHTFRSVGAVQLRAELLADAQHALSVSPTMRLTVKK